MRYLLDTNILIFMLSGERESISHDVQELVADFSNTLYTSSLSVLELIFLSKNQKIKTAFRSAEEIELAITNNLYITILHTKPEHFKVYSRLHLAENHKDQIDHFIISQAISERMPLVSSDRKFREYQQQNLNFIYNKR